MLLTSGGEQGVAAKFTSCGRIPRAVYISPGFLVHQASFCKFLQLAVDNTPGCKWKLHTEGWAALKADEKAGNLFALLRSGQLAAFDGRKHKFTAQSFL
eukprot:3278399-Pyramimonas_sp.AAC.1